MRQILTIVSLLTISTGLLLSHSSVSLVGNERPRRMLAQPFARLAWRPEGYSGNILKPPWLVALSRRTTRRYHQSYREDLENSFRQVEFQSLQSSKSVFTRQVWITGPKGRHRCEVVPIGLGLPQDWASASHAFRGSARCFYLHPDPLALSAGFHDSARLHVIE